MAKRCLALTVLLVASCDSGPEPILVEENALGVVSLEIDHFTEPRGSVMEIHGLDETGTEVAKLRLLKGLVTFSPEGGAPEVEEPRGSDLEVTVGDRTVHVVSPDLDVHETPRLDGTLGEFTRLRAVADALSRDAGITFHDRFAPRNDDEVAYSAGDCGSIYFPGNVSECAQYTNIYGGYSWIWQNGDLLSSRWTLQPAQVCKTSGGGGGCGQGGSMCAYGPCGGLNPPTNEASWGGGYPEIFGWGSGYAYNGWDTGYDNANGPYAGWPTHALRPGVTGSCTCNACGVLSGMPLPWGCAQAFWSPPFSCDIFNDQQCQRDYPDYCRDLCVNAGYPANDCLSWCTD